MLSSLYTLIASLPELLKLLEAISDAIKEHEIEMKVNDGVKTIHEALASGDANKLNALFGNLKPK